MKKQLYKLLVLIGLISTAANSANAQNFQLDIRNQIYSGDTMFFDVYMRSTTTGNFYLGDADFVLDFNSANFSSPTTDYVASSSSLTNSNASTTTFYNSNIVSDIVNNRIIINVLQPSFSGQTQFDDRIAEIDSNSETHKLGTFWVKGLTDPTQSPEIEWKTTGNPKTIAYSLDNTSPFKSRKINTLAPNDPTPTTEPTTQVTAFSVTGSTDTTLSLGWTNGNGTNTIILAKEATAVSTNLPADGVKYAADSFSVGDQIGTSGVYVVYNGTGTSTTVLNLDPATVYHFTALTFSGESGYSENYYLTSAATATDTTQESEPNTSATNLSITAFTTTTLDLSWTAGDGANRIIVARAGSAVSVTPTDATPYTAGSFTTGEDIGTSEIVVYDGSGTSTTVSGLSAGTEYYFAVYEYNGSNGSRNYKVDTPATANRFTLETEPTDPFATADFSNVTTTSMTFSFNSNGTGTGTGTNRLILVKSGSVVDADPADGQDYTANAAFTSGDQIGTGNYAVYNGADSTVTITGLTAGTIYYFEVFEYNGSDESANYLTSSTLTTYKTTLEAEPTTPPSAFVFTAWDTTELSFSWTSGDGANRIVVARAGSAVNFVPTDTNDYTANSTFGAGTGLGGSSDNYVIYNGSGSSASVSGLDSATEYYFAVYEYNGSSGSQNYLSTPATGQRYTLDFSPTTAASSGSFSSVTTSSMQFDFTAGDGDRRLILIREANAVNGDPTDGLGYTANAGFAAGDTIGSDNYVVYDGTSNTVTVTGLSAGTVYHFEVFEYNQAGSSDESDNYLVTPTLTASQTTLSAEPTAASTNFNFISWDTTELAFNWISSGAGTGSNRIVVARAGGAVNWTPSDEVAYTANSTFGAGTALNTDNYVIYNGTDTTASVSGLTAGTEYYFAVFEYNGSSGSENYYTTALTGNRFTPTTSPSTPASGASFSSVTSSSMQLDFPGGNGGRRLILIRESNAVNGDPEDGLAYTANAAIAAGDTIGSDNYVVYDGTGTSVTVTGLTANTTYHFEIFEYNQGSSNDETNNYLVNPTLTASQITLQDAPANQVTSFVVDSTNTNTAYLSWTNTASDSVIVIVRSIDSIGNSETPVSGTIYQANADYGTGYAAIGGGYVVYKGIGTSATVTNLGQDTMWHFAAFTFAGGSGSQAYNTTFNDNTDSMNTEFELDITVMLEGPMVYATMDTSLNVNGNVPTSQPYGMAPYYYSGTETATITASVVDWVLVEVRESSTVGAADSSTRVTRQAALLLYDGSIVDVDGSSPLTIDIDSALYGNAFVVVYHRNHIPVLSSTAATLATGGYSFDFTSATSQANGSNMTTVNGIPAMYAGNADPATDNSISANDRSAGWDDRNTSGYKSSDVNMDGYVDAADRAIIYNNAGADRDINN